jgi:NADH:ubiquinone reductase (H+-translocating)
MSSLKRSTQTRAEGRTLPAFRYRDLVATIGRKRAVAQIGAFKASGLFALLLWSLAHIYFLIGFPQIVSRSP